MKVHLTLHHLYRDHDWAEYTSGAWDLWEACFGRCCVVDPLYGQLVDSGPTKKYVLDQIPWQTGTDCWLFHGSSQREFL